MFASKIIARLKLEIYKKTLFVKSHQKASFRMFTRQTNRGHLADASKECRINLDHPGIYS